MRTFVDVLAVIGAATVVLAVIAAVCFVRQISKNGWNQ